MAASEDFQGEHLLCARCMSGLHSPCRRANMADVEATLERLALTFGVRDVMIPEDRLICADDEADARRQLEHYPDYNLIPFRCDGALHAYLERGSPGPKSITVADLISDGTSIPDLVDVLLNREFFFVL